MCLHAHGAGAPQTAGTVFRPRPPVATGAIRAFQADMAAEVSVGLGLEIGAGGSVLVSLVPIARGLHSSMSLL